jgi:hypothetical protein
MSSVSDADLADYERLNTTMNEIKVDIKKDYTAKLYLGETLPTHAQETEEIYNRLFEKINKTGGKPWQKSQKAMITFYTKITNTLIGDTSVLDLHTGINDGSNAESNGSSTPGIEVLERENSNGSSTPGSEVLERANSNGNSNGNSTPGIEILERAA